MTKQVERRRERRVTCKLLCEYELSKDHVQAETSNISLRGFFVETKQALTAGAQMSFRLRDRSWDKSLELVGRVAHVREDGMGIEILSIRFGNDEPYDWYQKLVQKHIRKEIK